MSLNAQPPEPALKSDGVTIDVHSIFPTIQGEGPFTGHVCVFLRLAGCSLMCPACDTEYTQGRRKVYYRDLANEVATVLFDMPSNPKLIVITGGEPTRQNLSFLINELVVLTGCHVQIESNGMHALPPDVAYMISQGHVTWVVSPKTSRIHSDTRLASVFKYVIDADSIRPEDGLPIKALGHTAKPYVARPPVGWKGSIYVNPMDSKDPEENKRHTWAARDVALKFGYILGVQLHKIVGVD